jgi:hypothetical protein
MIFTPHLPNDDSTQKKIEAGELFCGTLRYNPKFRDRAYITIDNLNIDVLIDGQNAMNRAFDSDKVAVRLESTQYWKPLEARKASGTAVADSKYSNQKAVEERMVDGLQVGPS